MESVRKWLMDTLARFSALSLTVRVGLITALVVALGAGAWAYAAGSKVEHGVLFSNLGDQDTAEVVEALGERRIPYVLEDSGHTITVPSDRVHETRLALASAGLPKGGGVGFEIFDEQRLGETDFSEQVKYHRALEGELTRTIQSLRGIKTARVHLVLPSRSLFMNDEHEASASVAVTLRAGAELSKQQVRGIVHLVASSVRGLKAENVTVVDGEGRSLTEEAEEQEGGDSVNRTLRFRREVEQTKERAIQQMLDATLGPSAAVVRVSADVNFSHEERTEESYDPARSVERSHQIMEERDPALAETATEGVPGAATNLPGGDPPSGGGQNDPDNALVRRTETRNYEVSRVTRHTTEPIGRVSRINAAVMVDFINRGTAERPNMQARTEQELNEIKEVVASAVGAQTDRGDQVTVRCVRFHHAPTEAPPKDVLAPARPYFPLVLPALALVAFLVLGIVGGLSMRRSKKAREAEREQLLALEKEQAAALPQPAAPSTLLGQTTVHVPVATMPTEELPTVDERVLLASQIATEDPQLAAKVLRQWLAESGGE